MVVVVVVLGVVVVVGGVGVVVVVTAIRKREFEIVVLNVRKLVQRQTLGHLRHTWSLPKG
jgi:hypothetical protein